MIPLVILLCGSFLISPSLGSENLSSQCHSDYLNLLIKHLDLQEKSLEDQDQEIQCQRVHSEVQNKYTVVLQKLHDCNVKNEKLQPKPLEVDALKALIIQQKAEIELLKHQIGELKEKCGLGSQVANNENQEKIQTESVKINTEGMPANQICSYCNNTARQLSDHCPKSQAAREMIHEIQLPGTNPFKVMCFQDEDMETTWMEVYKKISFSSAFSRPYEDYESGFGDVLKGLNDKYFIGLERLHLLTSRKPCEASVYSDEGITKCDHFVVGNRSEGYMLRNIGSCTGNSTIHLIQGTKFSTFNSTSYRIDNFAMNANGYGWWFDRNYTRTRNLVLLIRRTD